jgi:hypothetical protein
MDRKHLKLSFMGEAARNSPVCSAISEDDSEELHGEWEDIYSGAGSAMVFIQSYTEHGTNDSTDIPAG